MDQYFARPFTIMAFLCFFTFFQPNRYSRARQLFISDYEDRVRANFSVFRFFYQGNIQFVNTCKVAKYTGDFGIRDFAYLSVGAGMHGGQVV